MSLNASAMSQSIISQMSNVNPATAQEANKALGDAIQSYISGNASISYTWAGVNPSGTPDPITSFTAKFKSTPQITLSVSSSYPLFIIAFSSFLKSITILPSDSSFVMSPLTLLSTGLIVSTPSNKTTQSEALLSFSNDIITSLSTLFINPTPVAGVHGVYTGTGIMTLIN